MDNQSRNIIGDGGGGSRRTRKRRKKRKKRGMEGTNIFHLKRILPLNLS